MAKMRTNKNGGCSLCNASDENVGKRRCHHILDNNALEVRKEKGTNFIDISNINNISIEENKNTIRSYIKSISNTLTIKQQEEILSILREG